MKPRTATLALALTLTALVAFLVAMRPVCTCELGHPDRPYEANETSAEDCAVPAHGER